MKHWLLLFTFVVQLANAQDSLLVKSPKHSFSIGGGTAHYVGDLNRIKYAKYSLNTNVRWNGEVVYHRYINPKWTLNYAFEYARIYGDDFIYSQRNFEMLYQYFIRNLHFRNDLQSLSVSATRSFYLFKDNPSKTVSFVTFGMGLTAHNPKAIPPVQIGNSGPYISDQWLPLKQFNTSGQKLASTEPNLKPYSLLVPVFPLTFGVKHRFSQKLALSAEAGFRFFASDWIDDVGAKRYPNLNDLAAAYGFYVADFSYRAGEDFHVVSGESRIPLFRYAWEMAGGSNVPGLSPSNNAKTIYDPTLETTRRGTRGPFYQNFDFYYISAIKLHYSL